MAKCCKIPPPELWPFMAELWVVARNLVILFLLYNLIRLVCIRSKVWRLKSQGVPLMPYSLLFGHILVLRKLLAGLPKDLHPNYVPQIIYQNWRSLFPGRSSCPSVIYVDTWPMGPPTIFIVDPEMAARCIADPDVKRSHHTKEYLLPLTDNLDLISMEGGLWKAWRSRLNPAFSPKNVQSLVPAIIQDVQIFAQVIRRQVGENGSWGPVFQLQELATNLTIDVIGRAALGMELNEQTNGPSHFKAALMDQSRSCMFRFNIIDRIRHYDLRRSWAVARNRVEMNAKIFQAVIQCLNHKDNDDCKTIMGQSMKLVRDSADEKMASPLDPLFVQTVISQVKAFMLGGLDSTATTICWVLHVLAKNPEIAKRSPHLLSSLTYTAGVIMETLRLYPVIGPLRDGSSRYEFVDLETGVSCPTDGCLVVDAVRALATAEEIWPRAAEVIPERWMTTDPSDPLYAPKYAWRMFGHGPRVCIGQELALTEIKLAIVFLVREFDLDCSWEKWNAMRIRRVKCDEARPSCNRCITTGRKCDGYITPPPGVYTWTALLRANPTSQQTVAEPELRALSFFRTVVAPVLAGPLDDLFWTQLVNQVSHQEKAAKHAVLTISSLYEKFKENPLDRLAGEKNLFAVTNYNQAIRHLRTTDNQETVLLVCILFVCIDMLRGECKGAIDHCRHGINILNSVHHKSAFVRDHLEPAFCRLGVFPFFFGVPPESFPVIETEAVVPKAPFRTVAELQAGLNPLLVQTIRFVRSADAYRLADDRMPKPGPTTMQKRVDIDAALDAWEVGFRRWKEKRHVKKASRPDIVEHILEMKWLVGKIWIDTCMSRGETIFDLHMDKFQRIINIARDAERIVRIPRQNKRRAKFTFEMGFSPLLGFVVVKCRSLSLRVAARELMKTLAHEREHLWDNNTMLAIGRKRLLSSAGRLPVFRAKLNTHTTIPYNFSACPGRPMYSIHPPMDTESAASQRRRRRRRVADVDRKRAPRACERCKARKNKCVETASGTCLRCLQGSYPCRFERERTPPSQHATTWTAGTIVCSTVKPPSQTPRELESKTGSTLGDGIKNDFSPGGGAPTDAFMWPRFLSRLREAFCLDSQPASEERDMAKMQARLSHSSSADPAELRRVRRAVKGFPPESVADFLVSVCITYGTDIFFYFDQTHFVSELRSFYSDATSKLRTDTAFVCLALAVFALGSHWTSLAKPDGAISENLPEEIDPGRVFYNQARILIADILDRPSLQSVQAAFVLGVYLMPASAISASYVYMGLALRKALAIGLHLEPDDPGLGEDEREMRRRLWWSIYSLERTVTIKLNRPRSISQDIITARMPQPLSRDKSQKFDNVLHQIANAQLVRIIDKISDTLPCTSEISETEPIPDHEAALKEWKRALPASLKLQNIHPKSLSYRAVFHLHLNYYFSWIDMGKVSVVTVVRARLRTVFCPDEGPSEVRRSIEKSSEACIKAAKKMLELFEGLSKSGNMARFSFTDLQGCSIATIVVLLAGILDRDSGYEGRVAFGLDCLRQMASGGNTTARTGARFVEALQAITNEARAKLLTVNRESTIQHPAVSGQTSGYGDWKDWVTNFETMNTSSDGEGEAQPSDSCSPNLGESGVTGVMLPTPWDEAAALQLQEMSAGDFRVPMAAPGDIMDDQGGEALPSADDGWPPLFVGNDDQMYLMGLTGMDVLDFTGGFT
ncbi:putative sterigmatocystin biosynthesis P450 monooxygenase stcS [Colletotrichum trifolii]|uniref:Putative sterigmatocystin biosynthesis P450 monooxygenase stcS n=1 Tax=Colletotrichum trifolii TaxID=5466 RepID=A0A4R8R8L0_COLTR|nr:putative sterigmatocystin biosynthesis P450 monooxygenase stcS [Colletotrichum trifolii]